MSVTCNARGRIGVGVPTTTKSMKMTMNISKSKVRVSTAAAVVLLVLIAAAFSLHHKTPTFAEDVSSRSLLSNEVILLEDRSNTLQELKRSENIWYSRFKNNDIYAALNEKHTIHRSQVAGLLDQQRGIREQLSICKRQTNVGTPNDLSLLLNGIENTCPGINSNKLLLLQGELAFGRTGNNLIEFFHALQLARENDYQLGVMTNSWVFELLQSMWFSGSQENWQDNFERAFCIKIFHPNDSLKDWSPFFMGINPRNTPLFTKVLFNFKSELPLDEYIAFQSRYLQMLFRHYNTTPDQNMCSGINAIFGEEAPGAIYSVIHNRHLEGAPGIRLMQRMTRGSGCHPTAALEMEPEYIKSILGPIGMLKHPIVLITDGEDQSVATRLMNDPEIGPNLRLVPESASWIGGDLTLGVMSNVFIGNPASTFSGFIAKSRIALGFGHNHLFRAKVTLDNGEKEWVPTCGDTCIFDKHIIGNMA